VQPLGKYWEFSAWSGRPRTWGPDDRYRVWFAGGVLDGLASVIDDHVKAVRQGSRYGDPIVAAIGCVPWLTSDAIVDRLAALPACCIVVSKWGLKAQPSLDAAMRLMAAGNGFPNVTPDLVDMAPPEEAGNGLLGPEDEFPRYLLGPVRVAGWRKKGPLLHAKILVLGTVLWAEDEVGRELQIFSPDSVWWGSANWTSESKNHLEVGSWVADQGLARDARDFVSSVIQFSESWESVAEDPEPDLVRIDYDFEALADYAAEWGPWEDPDDD
jgi:hypothetical protein